MSQLSASLNAFTRPTIIDSMGGVTAINPPCSVYGRPTGEDEGTEDSSGVRALPSSSLAAMLESMRFSAVDELVRYLGFERGWDGYDGESFRVATVEKAVQIIDKMVVYLSLAGAEPAEITPGPASDGRIDIEAACEGRRLIVTIQADPGDQRAEIYFRGDGDVHEAMAQWNGAEVERWIRRLSGADRLPSAVRDHSSDSGWGKTLALGL